MSEARQLPLYDAALERGSWNERMVEGEFAVHYSSHDAKAGTPPYCTVFCGMKGAEEYARGFVVENPMVRCTIYDHQGRVGAPLRDFRGSEYKDTELTSRFRRWVGGTLFFGGVGLTTLDWVNDFSLSWPAMVGTRMLIPGLMLLFTEVMIMLHERHVARTETA
jgi:hypothetical protein